MWTGNREIGQDIESKREPNNPEGTMLMLIRQKLKFKHQQNKEGTYTMKKDKILGIQELAGTDL